MKKLVLASALMMAFGMNAYASDSVDLKVTGTLTLTACNPTFENGG
ncbi:fimbrial assembly protein, partial [Cronobacter sakazakii]